MSIHLVGLWATGSGSLKAEYSTDVPFPAGAVAQLWVGTSDVFEDAILAVDALPPAGGLAFWYSALAATEYWAWMVLDSDDTQVSIDGPLAATTFEAFESQDALGATQKDALQAWASSSLGWMYSVLWVRQDLPQPPLPAVTLRAWGLKTTGTTDSQVAHGEGRVGAREAVLTVEVQGQTNAPPWTLATFPSPAAGTYTLNVGAVPVAVTVPSSPSPTPTIIAAALVAQVVALNQTSTPTGVTAWQVAQDLGTLALAPTDPANQPVVTVAAGSIELSSFQPPDTDILAARLETMTRDPDQVDTLQAVNVALATTGQIQDLSMLLEIEYQERFSFDINMNLVMGQAQTLGVIDTVAPAQGTYLN